MTKSFRYAKCLFLVPNFCQAHDTLHHICQASWTSQIDQKFGDLGGGFPTRATPNHLKLDRFNIETHGFGVPPHFRKLRKHHEASL